MDQLDKFDPEEVARLIAEALETRSILPISFIETSVFEALSNLLPQYMNSADAAFVISEIRSSLLQGFTKITPQRLHDVTVACRKCTKDDAVEYPAVVPSWNCTDPDLMIIADNPLAVSQYSSLLRDSLKSAGFSSQRCILTYVTRCQSYQPTRNAISNCVGYLHTEIAVLKPKLIVTLGIISYCAISGESKVKLADIKGSVRWIGPYAILPESSLAWGAHTVNKENNDKPYLHSSLSKAYQFLYGSSVTQ